MVNGYSLLHSNIDHCKSLSYKVSLKRITPTLIITIIQKDVDLSHTPLLSGTPVSTFK